MGGRGAGRRGGVGWKSEEGKASAGLWLRGSSEVGDASARRRRKRRGEGAPDQGRVVLGRAASGRAAVGVQAWGVLIGRVVRGTGARVGGTASGCAGRRRSAIGRAGLGAFAQGRGSGALCSGAWLGGGLRFGERLWGCCSGGWLGCSWASARVGRCRAVGSGDNLGGGRPTPSHHESFRSRGAASWAEAQEAGGGASAGGKGACPPGRAGGIGAGRGGSERAASRRPAHRARDRAPKARCGRPSMWNTAAAASAASTIARRGGARWRRAIQPRWRQL